MDPFKSVYIDCETLSTYAPHADYQVLRGELAHPLVSMPTKICELCTHKHVETKRRANPTSSVTTTPSSGNASAKASAEYPVKVPISRTRFAPLSLPANDQPRGRMRTCIQVQLWPQARPFGSESCYNRKSKVNLCCQNVLPTRFGGTATCFRTTPTGRSSCVWAKVRVFAHHLEPQLTRTSTQHCKMQITYNLEHNSIPRVLSCFSTPLMRASFQKRFLSTRAVRAKRANTAPQQPQITRA